MSSTSAGNGASTKVAIAVIGASAIIVVLFVIVLGAGGPILGTFTDEEPSTATPGEPASGEPASGEPASGEPASGEQASGDDTGRTDGGVGAAPDDESIPSTPDRRLVTLIAHSVGQVYPRSTYADLSDGEVLRMSISREGSSRGTIQQCVVEHGAGTDGLTRCGNGLPVMTDELGNADVLYQVVDTGTCGRNDRCVVAVRFPADNQLADAFIVFGDGPPALTVGVEPAGPYLTGDEVRVDVGAATPGATLSVRRCSDTCADPILGTATSEGRFSTTVEIDDECVRCRVVVSAGSREVAYSLAIADGPGASYSLSRLLFGLAAAAAFLGAAVLIARRTDWRPPSEAATPAFDGPWRWDDLLDDD